MPQLAVLGYEERLRAFNLYSMEQRRLRGGLTLMYRIMTDDLLIEKEKLFTIADTKTRGNYRLKVQEKERCCLKIRQAFFTI